MQPPRDPPQRRVTTREEARLPHTEGDIIRVTGRAHYANELRLPTPIRIKTVVPISGLNNPTIEELYRLCHTPGTLQIVKEQAEDTLTKLNAEVDDDINCGLACVVMRSAPMRAPSTASESTSPAEEINTGFTGTSGRTSSRPPAKVRREEEWAPTMNRVTPMSMEEAAANRGRRSRRDDEAQSMPARPAGIMGVAKNTTPQSQRTRPSPATDFSADDESSLRPSGGGKAKGRNETGR